MTASSPAGEDPRRARVQIPGTAVTMSRLVLGTMTFGLQVDDSGAAEILERCAAAGITSLDTANVYTGGATEAMLGRLLHTGGREGIFSVATKVGGSPSPDAPDLPPLSAKAVRQSVEGSLRRLGAEHVDICYLHQPDRETPVAETLDVFGELVEEGKVGVLGVSNHSAWQISELIWTARLGGLPEPRISQPIYNLLSRRLEEEYAEFARQAGLRNVVYNPLAGGLLTGKHVNAPQQHGRFSDIALSAMYRDRYWSPPLLAAVEQFRGVADEAGLTLVELALRWLLNRDEADAILLGASTLQQLEQNLDALAEGSLDDVTARRCDEIWLQLRGAAPVYNR